MTEFASVAIARIEWIILAYFLVVNAFYFVLLVSAALEIRKHRRLARGEERSRMLGSPVVPRISILAPAYNEEASIAESVGALLALHYPNLEIVVINDGSSDETIRVLRDSFDLEPVHPIYRRRIASELVHSLYYSAKHPNLIVADKLNGGKADALNAGLNLAGGELVCSIDADTLIEADALQRMVRPFIGRDDVLAAGGTIRIANGSVVRGGRVVRACAPRRALPGLQAVEYLRAFLFGRLGWNRLGDNIIISGAFGLFQRDAMLAAGGYLHETVGEDMELVLRLRRRGYETGGPHRTAFVPDPVAWTQVPETLRVLGRQRDRWHRGLADVLWRHRDLLFNPRYRAMGMVAMPYFVFIELVAPVVEALGLVVTTAGLLLGLLDYSLALLVFLAAYGVGGVLSAATLVLEEVSFRRYDKPSDRLVLAGWALCENVGYRQLTVLWRLQGLVKYLRGRGEWGAMERRGFSPQSVAAGHGDAT